MSDLKLAEGFAAADEAAWRALAEAALKGASFEKLRSRTPDGIGIEPLYPQTSEGHAIGVEAGWRVLGRIDHPDAGIAAEIARDEIAGGAKGLLFVLADASGGHRLPDGADPASLIGGADLASLALHLEAGAGASAALTALMAMEGVEEPDGIVLRFGLFPNLLAHGLDETAWHEEAAHLLTAVAEAPKTRLFCADARLAHNAGASEAQELAVMLADLVAQLRHLEERGVEPDDGARRLSLALSADTDQFATMAKLRAARLLVARVLSACGAGETALPLHVETSRRMLTRRDPWVNMLRTTAAVAAAGLAGADTMSALPHTAPIGVPHGSARRLARNTQLILLEESGLGRVGDPAAGSGYVEALTEELCAAAWALFQEIEGAGGLAASLREGTLQARIGETRDRRLADIRTRRQPLTGTSEFPWLDEPSVRLDAADRAPARVVGPVDGIAPLAPMHLDAEFEALRARSDAVLAETGSRPTVFLAPLGHLAEHSTRTGWARAAFASGGIDAVTGPDEASPDDLAQAFAESGCAVACLCASDELYGEQGAAAAEALKAKGCERLFLAGRPKELTDGLTRAGVDAFLYAGCDMIEGLESAYAAIGKGQPQ